MGGGDPTHPAEPSGASRSRRRRSTGSPDRRKGDARSARTWEEREAARIAREEAAAAEVEADPEAVARRILLDALTGQARARQELADKLAKGVPDALGPACSTGSPRSA